MVREKPGARQKNRRAMKRGREEDAPPARTGETRRGRRARERKKDKVGVIAGLVLGQLLECASRFEYHHCRGDPQDVVIMKDALMSPRMRSLIVYGEVPDGKIRYVCVGQDPQTWERYIMRTEGCDVMCELGDRFSL